MQAGVTTTRDSRLLSAAEHVEREGNILGSVLRESRLEIWEEVDAWRVQELALLMDETLAQQCAETVVCARLTVPYGEEPWIGEDFDRVLEALRRQEPSIDYLELVEADPEELPRQEPDAPVVVCTWNGMWFRSKAEMRIAQA